MIYSSVHFDRVYHFIQNHFSRIPLYMYISFNGPREKDERTRNIWAIKNDRFSRAKYAWLYRCACYIWWFFYELMFICTYVYLHTITAYILFIYACMYTTNWYTLSWLWKTVFSIQIINKVQLHKWLIKCPLITR